jgi:predicted RecA/RadA family phage recombinase
MKNFIQNGDVITIPAAPYARTSGQGVLMGSLFGICTSDAAAGASVEVVNEGICDVTALTTDVGTVGTKMYWDDTNKRLTVTAAGSVLVGVLVAAKAGTDTTARVYLDGVIR